MHKTCALVLFSLIVASRSASFNPSNERNKPNSANDDFDHTNDHAYENYKYENVNDGAENQNYEMENEVTALGYHMKIGVPKAIELMKFESLQSRIVGGSQVASASANPHQV